MQRAHTLVRKNSSVAVGHDDMKRLRFTAEPRSKPGAPCPCMGGINISPLLILLVCILNGEGLARVIVCSVWVQAA